MAQVKFLRGTYSQWYAANPIIADGTFVLVLRLPWYKSWFGLKSTRLKVGDGITEFKKLRFL